MGNRMALPFTLAVAVLTTLPLFSENATTAFAAKITAPTAYETRGDFVAWSLYAFGIPKNQKSPLPRHRYTDVNPADTYLFGQAMKLGLITPNGSHTLGVRVPLTKAEAAAGLVHLLHIATGHLTPLQFAVKNGWFKGTSAGANLRREDMHHLFLHVKSTLTNMDNSSLHQTGTDTSNATTDTATATTPVTPFQIPSVPAAGEQNLVMAPSAAQVAANHSLRIQTAFPAKRGQSVPVQIQSIIYDPNNPNIVVTGKEATNGKQFYPEVWLQISDMGTSPNAEYNQWQYPINVNADGTFAYVLHVPFAADPYEVQVAPPLTTAQTTLTYTFDTKEQSVSYPFTMSYTGEDSNKQLGLLTSVWANYTDPAIQTLAQKITAGLTSPLAMARAVYNWEGQNIGYNGKLLANNGYGWSTTEETLKSNVGICVDYSNVADALLRSLGIPTQMVVGYANDGTTKEVDNGNIGHAWNRSWINGSWIYFDPTWSRLYFLPSTSALPGPQDLWVFQSQWFNPPGNSFATTHDATDIGFQ